MEQQQQEVCPPSMAKHPAQAQKLSMLKVETTLAGARERIYRCLSSNSVLLVHHDLSFAIGALQADGVPHVEPDWFFTPKSQEGLGV